MSDDTAPTERASWSLVAIRPAGATKTERYQRELARGFDHYGPLIPAQDCQAIVAELERRLRPIGVKQCSSHVRRLAGCWPTPPHDSEVWTAAAAAELAALPEDLAREAVEIISTSNKWLPSRFEIRQVAVRLLSRRTRMLATAREHLAEHERRAAEAVRTARIAPVKAAIGDEWDIVVACQRERFGCMSVEAQDRIVDEVERQVADGVDFAEAVRDVADEIRADPAFDALQDRIAACRRAWRT